MIAKNERYICSTLQSSLSVSHNNYISGIQEHLAYVSCLIGCITLIAVYLFSSQIHPGISFQTLYADYLSVLVSKAVSKFGYYIPDDFIHHKAQLQRRGNLMTQVLISTKSPCFLTEVL